MEGYNSDVDNVTFNETFNVDGSLMSTSLLENTHAPISSNTDNGERITNVINPNTQTIIPENEGEMLDTGFDMSNFIHQHRAIGQAISEFREHVRNGFRAKPPLLNINLHEYEATNSTCLETKEHCTICLEEYSEKEELARIDCGHMYHIHCLKKWNKIDNTCPICKRRVAVICHFTLRIRALQSFGCSQLISLSHAQ